MTTKTALRMADVAIDSLAIIQSMTKIGGPKAAAALHAIDKVINVLKDGLDGVASPQAVANEIEALKSALHENDDAADAELREKFKR